MRDVNVLVNAIKENPDNYRVLERVPLNMDITTPFMLTDTLAVEPITITMLDFETTGFKPPQDVPIEIGLVQVEYCTKNNQLTRILHMQNHLEDPLFELPEMITAITGITNADVKGQRFDDAAILDLIDESDIVIAHSARFDRSFFDHRFPSHSDTVVWGCSIKDISWFELGFESSKLEYLLYKNGYFYDGHRAVTDCLAMVQLFIEQPRALKVIIDSTKIAEFVIYAEGVQYANKDLVKDRGYQWNAARKVWHTTCLGRQKLEQEMEFLAEVSGDRAGNNYFQEISINGRHRG